HPARLDDHLRLELRGADRLRGDAGDGRLQPRRQALPPERRPDRRGRRRDRHRSPMTDLKRTLSEAVEAAFAAEGVPAELGRVTPSDRPDLADFQSNGALAAAKRLGRNPREIAAAVAARLEGDPRLAAVEIAGPGFINFRLSDAALSARAG